MITWLLMQSQELILLATYYGFWLICRSLNIMSFVTLYVTCYPMFPSVFFFPSIGVSSQFAMELDMEVARYRQKAFACSTRKTYSTHFQMYLKFCQNIKCSPVPLSNQNLSRFTAFLARTLSPTSILVYLNIVRILHLEAGFPNPLNDNFHLKTVLKGIKREKGSEPKRVLPITPELLLKIYQRLDMSSPYWAYFWAACLVAFFGFLRKSNLFMESNVNHFLKRRDVLMTKNGHVSPGSKL